MPAGSGAGARRHTQGLAALVGVAGYGVGAYAFLVIAGRALGADRFADLSVLWTAVFLGVVGLLVPVEQESARAIGTAVARGDAVDDAAVDARLATSLVAAIAAVAVVLGAPLISRVLFEGHIGFVVVLACALVAYGFVHGERAVLVGTGRLTRFSALLLADAGARTALLLVLLLAGLRSGLGIAVVVAASPLAALLVVAPRALRLRGAHGRWVPLLRRIAPLIVAALAGQLTITFPGLAVRALTDEGESAAVGSYLAAVSVARAPILLFAAFEAAMVPTLTALAAHRRFPEMRSLMARYVAGVAAVGAACTAAGAIVLGPALRIAFGPAFVVDLGDSVLVLAGTGSFLVALVIGQGLLTLGRRRDLIVPWAFAVAVEVAVVAATSGDLPRRASASYALASTGAAAAAGMLLLRALRAAQRTEA